MSSKRSSGVSEAATKVDAKRKGNLTVMTKGGTKKSNTYYFALGETALYYFTSDAVCSELWATEPLLADDVHRRIGPKVNTS